MGASGGDELRLVRGQAALWFGGDYNPEQWPAPFHAADLAAMEQLGVNAVTLPVFSWGALQPSKDSFDFSWLDPIVESLTARGLDLVLATPTAAQPAWMSQAYPEVLPVDAAGRRRRHGGRVNYCPTSIVYRESSAQIAAALAERYGSCDALKLWHVNNEYGPVCFCDGCLDGFRGWLRDRYGDIASLNAAWGTSVWGHTLYDWSEVELPSRLNDMGQPAHGQVRFAPSPSVALDHARFASTALLECFLNEKAALREHTPDVAITTNFHGPVQTVDWHEWGPHVDLVSWDSYPLADSAWSHAAFGHDLARGAGRRREFLLMEAAPGPVNWHARCALKRPGELRLEALQAIARGSRGALYFQIRQARAGPELNHAALIPRHGRLDTRTGRELEQIGRDLAAVGVLPDDHDLQARVAIVFDWTSWWAHHNTPGLDQRSRYFDAVRDVHRALAERGCLTDVVGVAGPFDGYEVVVAPLLHVVGRRTAESFGDYVRAGGTLVTTAGSAIVGDDGQVHVDGVEPLWRELVGLWVEETDVQPPAVVNRVEFLDGSAPAEASELFDIVRVETAAPIAAFGDDFYAGAPAVSVNRFGDGSAVYVASPSGDLVGAVVDRFTSKPPEGGPRGELERVAWTSAAEVVELLLNHGERSLDVTLDGDGWVDVLSGEPCSSTLSIAGRDAAVVRRAGAVT